MKQTSMHLKVLTPMNVAIDEDVTKVAAEAGNGAFALLPRHVDFVTALVPGLLSYETTGGSEHVLAVDVGTLVKTGADVLVSVRQAITGAELGALREAVESKFKRLDEHERKARTALARLEADLVQQFVEMNG